MKIVGGLAAVRQFTAFEQPFWETEISTLSGGRITASIHPFDRSGIRSQDMLHLIKTGVVPFGHAAIAVAATDTPALQGIDLPGLNPDFASLRRTIEAYRSKLRAVLRDVHDTELLGIYSYPAQVLFCARPFDGIESIKNFKVRTSSVAQSELMIALGAQPVVTPFSEIVAAVQRKTVDCAITGILSGHEIGLGDVTTHIHASAITWGVTIFGANRTAWMKLPAETRELLAAAVRTLEDRILAAAEEDTEQGLACSRGLATCKLGVKRPQTVVTDTRAHDVMRLQRFGEMVLPQWLERCGSDCESLEREGLLTRTSTSFATGSSERGGAGN